MASGARREEQGKRGTFGRFTERFPALVEAHGEIANAIQSEGVLDARTTELIKIGICMGAGLESALRSHVRRARDAGASVAEIEIAIALGMTSVGFPRTVASWSWAHEQFMNETNQDMRR